MESVNDDGPTKIRILNLLIILEKVVVDLQGKGFPSAQDIRVNAEFASWGREEEKTDSWGKFGTNTKIIKYQALYIMFLNNSF